MNTFTYVAVNQKLTMVPLFKSEEAALDKIEENPRKGFCISCGKEVDLPNPDSDSPQECPLCGERRAGPIAALDRNGLVYWCTETGVANVNNEIPRRLTESFGKFWEMDEEGNLRILDRDGSIV